MEAVTKWITIVGIVLVIAWLVAPGSQSPAVLKAIGGASSANIKALVPSGQAA